MWVRRKEYERLKNCEKLKEKLEKEVSRLAAQVSAKVEDCKIGTWCRDCEHMGYDFSQAGYFKGLLGLEYVKEVAGEVVYCKKHLHELCPEYERKKK